MDYSEKVMDHFANPRNCRLMEDANGVGTVGNPTCGDLMTIYIKVNDDEIGSWHPQCHPQRLTCLHLSNSTKRVRPASSVLEQSRCRSMSRWRPSSIILISLSCCLLIMKDSCSEFISQTSTEHPLLTNASLDECAELLTTELSAQGRGLEHE